jgi:hypothetical protein
MGDIVPDNPPNNRPNRKETPTHVDCLIPERGKSTVGSREMNKATHHSGRPAASQGEQEQRTGTTPPDEAPNDSRSAVMPPQFARSPFPLALISSDAGRNKRGWALVLSIIP